VVERLLRGRFVRNKWVKIGGRRGEDEEMEILIQAGRLGLWVVEGRNGVEKEEDCWSKLGCQEVGSSSLD
jgi:hypothetical protein